MNRVCDDLVLGRFTFDGYLDHQDEMEIAAEVEDQPVRSWIDKEDAQALINHLTKVFNL